MTVPELPDFTLHWVGLASLAVFLVAYGLVVSEEFTHLHKSKPVVVAAGVMWIVVVIAYGAYGKAEQATEILRHALLEYAELMLFVLVAITYLNTIEERRVFDALRAWLLRRRYSYRTLFWLTGGLAFVLSPAADNLTTALVMCSVVLATGAGAPRFVAVSCINIVVAANAGGAFSPFGDITTLMVWQKGLVSFSQFFHLFVPAVVSFLVPAALMQRAVPHGSPAVSETVITMKIGAGRVILLFALTIATAVLGKTFLHLPAAIGMMTGLGYLQIFDYYFQYKERRGANSGGYTFDTFQRIASVEWDTLLFFYGVIMCVAALGALGYLAVASQLMFGVLGPTTANTLVGLLSAILDNIPLMFAVLTMQPDMPLNQWLLITLTAGVGGSLLSVGSAAGVAVMGRARGAYTFTAHLRWTPAIGLGYAAGILTHLWFNRGLL